VSGNALYALTLEGRIFKNDRSPTATRGKMPPPATAVSTTHRKNIHINANAYRPSGGKEISLLGREILNFSTKPASGISIVNGSP
jgi:hypothetical protein